MAKNKAKSSATSGNQFSPHWHLKTRRTLHRLIAPKRLLFGKYQFEAASTHASCFSPFRRAHNGRLSIFISICANSLVASLSFSPYIYTQDRRASEDLYFPLFLSLRDICQPMRTDMPLPPEGVSVASVPGIPDFTTFCFRSRKTKRWNGFFVYFGYYCFCVCVFVLLT